MKTLWEVIKESRTKKIISSKEQTENLEKIYGNLSEENLLSLDKEWEEKYDNLVDDDRFKELHVDEGGIIDASDDGFYEDFACWVIAQGVELYNAFMKDGAEPVIRYIEDNDIYDYDYEYENLRNVLYNFQPWI